MFSNVTLIFIMAILNPLSLYAAGSYYVGKDAGGVYFQIDQDGGWYIDRKDLKHFKVGDTGTYSIAKDQIGTYLSTDSKRKFYIDVEAKSKLNRKVEAFNAAEEKRLRDLRGDENKRRKTAERGRLLTRATSKPPQPVKLEIHITREQYDENSHLATWVGPGYYPYTRSWVQVRPNDRPPRERPPTNTRPGATARGAGEFPWWKSSLYTRY